MGYTVGQITPLGYKQGATASVTNAAEILAAKANVRYLIHYVGISNAAAAGDANTIYGIAFIQGGASVLHVIKRTTALATVTNSDSNPDYLTDVNTAITVSLTGALTAGYIRIAYQEVSI